MTTTVFLDLETTGLSDYHQPWEFGLLVRRDPSLPDDARLYAVRPDLSDADPAALAVGRYYERTAGWAKAGHGRGLGNLASPGGAGGWSDREAVARELASLLDGAVVVGCNVQYDLRLLGRWLRESGECPTWHYRPVDVGALAWGHLHGRVAELDAVAAAAGVGAAPPTPELAGVLALPWSTSKLAAALGVPEQDPAERHTALGDARFARDLFDAVVGGRSA